ncbi:unnamed protein product [Protopolystoma xenopodis]|uniref:Uncharacterized protein n=1 Tax=Protopolystoma xenopodis TaxID=117903 RepID=A0A3S5CD49_9PLAT|nr:unnamed protein product [Protopolystoma xenopodis]
MTEFRCTAAVWLYYKVQVDAIHETSSVASSENGLSFPLSSELELIIVHPLISTRRPTSKPSGSMNLAALAAAGGLVPGGNGSLSCSTNGASGGSSGSCGAGGVHLVNHLSQASGGIGIGSGGTGSTNSFVSSNSTGAASMSLLSTTTGMASGTGLSGPRKPGGRNRDRAKSRK